VKRWWLLATASLAVAALAAVAVVWAVARPGPTGQVAVVSPFEPCPAPTRPVPATAPGAPAGSALPRVVLPCFTEGEPVELAALGRPAVVALWASWCRPCRSELPQFQRFAGAHASEVDVIGVVTQDTRPAAASLAVDLNIDFPALFDRDGSLLHAIGRAGLPVTLFIDASGRLRHIATGGTLTVSTLESLCRQWLGVQLR
jgi:thiol-disulfide isomerase/thioredoxin